MNPPRATFQVRAHVICVEQLERYRFAVSVDGHRLATFCSESRARSAGRSEARRLDLVAQDAEARR